MYLNGIMLVSSVLNFQTILFDVGNDLPHVVYLPTYAATAWYHKRLPPDLQQRTVARGRRRGASLRAGRVRDGAARRATRCRPPSAPTSPASCAAHRAVGRLRRARQPAARRSWAFVQGAAARRAHYRRPPRQPLHRHRPRRARARPRVRPEHVGHHGPVHRRAERLRARRAEVRERRALRDSDRTRAAVGLRRARRTATSTSPRRCARRWRRTRTCACSSPTATTTWPRRSAAPSGRSATSRFDGDYPSRVEMKYYEAGHMMYVHLPSLAAQGRDLRQFIMRRPRSQVRKDLP